MLRGPERGCWLVATAAVMSPTAHGVAHAEPRTHDEAQIRIAAGAGYWFDAVTPTAEEVVGWDDHGAAADVRVFAGGTPLRGLTVGGTFDITLVPSPGETWTTLSVQAYVDYYPDPKGGFHVLGAVGPTLLLADHFRSADAAPGVAASVGTGYDFWLSSETSLGPIIFLNYGHTYRSAERSDLVEDTASAVLAASLTFQ
jgi:hypothetical protein